MMPPDPSHENKSIKWSPDKGPGSAPAAGGNLSGPGQGLGNVVGNGRAGLGEIFPGEPNPLQGNPPFLPVAGRILDKGLDDVPALLVTLGFMDRPETPPADQEAGLDRAAALARLGGNERLLRSVAAEFTQDYAACATTLRQALAAGDLDAARRLAHTVKGVAGNIAADALAAAARDLETSLAQGRLPPDASLDAFAAALKRTIAATAKLAPPAGPVSPAPSPAATPTWRILLVDDARLNRAIFTQILTDAGHEVVAAVNGKEACRLLFGEKAPGRPFDCILMRLNCLAGVRPPNFSEAEATATLVDNIIYAADVLAGHGRTLLLEAVNAFDSPDFLLHRTDQVEKIITAVDRPNVAIQYDVYHDGP